MSLCGWAQDIKQVSKTVKHHMRGRAHLGGGVHGLVVEVHGAPAAVRVAHVQLARRKGVLAPDVLPHVAGVVLVLVLVPVVGRHPAPVCTGGAAVSTGDARTQPFSQRSCSIQPRSPWDANGQRLLPLHGSWVMVILQRVPHPSAAMGQQPVWADEVLGKQATSL